MSEPALPRSWGDRLADLVHDLSEPGRFERGVALAREGAVADVRTAAGSLVAVVRGSGGRVYQSALAARPLAADEAAGLAAAVTARPHLLLDLLAHSDAAAAHALGGAGGCELFPFDPDLLHFACSCPDGGDPCKHAVALALVAADLVHRTPALWLVMRDVPLDELADGLVPDEVPAPGAEPLEECLEDYFTPRAAVPRLAGWRRPRPAPDERDEHLLRAVLRPDLPRVRRASGAAVEQRVDDAVDALRLLYAGIVRGAAGGPGSGTLDPAGAGQRLRPRR
ncbi:SWIM zinc finger family protein [Kineococcus glutinatus]|uniref:SWIM-type domain-containing protein n=1 Tax=Kineococcus glutinatus TaxID=1070872 RepID=A0ABP9I1Q5_9ACTN